MNSLSSTPQNNAGAFAAMAAGASHSAVLLSWRTRRASVVTAAKLCSDLQLACSAPLKAAAMLATVATAIAASELMRDCAQRTNRARWAELLDAPT